MSWSSVPNVPGSNPTAYTLDCVRICMCKWRSGALPCKGGATASQLDQPSLTPLSIAGSGRLQLGVAYWATSGEILQVFENSIYEQWQ